MGQIAALQPDTTTTWDPGGLEEPDMPPVRNDRVYATISQSYSMDEETSRTELDSHANMPVFGRHAFIVGESTKSISVSPFTPDYEPITVPVVNAVIQYDHPYNGQQYHLLFRNALYVPSMQHNLIPPFILREAGFQINDVPRIHLDDPSNDDHALHLDDDARIPLQLHGIFSYFPTSKPDHSSLQAPENLYLLTPEHWNPHSPHFAINEDAMLDWEGNIKEPRDRPRYLVDELPDDDVMAAALTTSPSEEQELDRAFANLSLETTKEEIPWRESNSSSTAANPILKEATLLHALEQRRALSGFMMTSSLSFLTALSQAVRSFTYLVLTVCSGI